MIEGFIKLISSKVKETLMVAAVKLLDDICLISSIFVPLFSDKAEPISRKQSTNLLFISIQNLHF